MENVDKNHIIDLVNSFAPDKYPEVYNLGQDILPFDARHWFGHAHIFSQLLQSKNIKLAVEVGSWLGGSARFTASNLPPDALLLCVDTWLGSEENQVGAVAHIIDLAILYRQFLSNTIHNNLQDRMIPIRMPSLETASHLSQLGFKFDFIYIDAAHDYENVIADMRAWYPLLAENGIFCGDDFNHPPIVKAVNEFALEKGLRLISGPNFWQLV